jgi:hypothetical protein
MWVLANKLADINDALMSVVERQPYAKIACILCRNDKYVFHL